MGTRMRPFCEERPDGFGSRSSESVRYREHVVDVALGGIAVSGASDVYHSLSTDNSGRRSPDIHESPQTDKSGHVTFAISSPQQRTGDCASVAMS